MSSFAGSEKVGPDDGVTNRSSKSMCNRTFLMAPLSYSIDSFFVFVLFVLELLSCYLEGSLLSTNKSKTQMLGYRIIIGSYRTA